MSAAPKTYTQKFTVYRHDGDHLGNVKPGALLRYAQQIATTHAEAAGLTDEVYTATRTAFVLAKLALHIDRTPRVDEELTLVTQPECCKRAVNKRITHFYDAAGEEVAVIDSRWVLIDIDKRIILRKHPEQFADHWAEDVPFALPMKMTKAAQKEYPGLPVVCAGGVMSSDIIRQWVQQRLPQVYFVPGQYSSDNAIGVSILAAREVGSWLK